MEDWRVCLVVGDYKLTYLVDVDSLAVDLLETKLLINSVILDADKGANFMSCDLKYVFLVNMTKEAEYIKVSF